MRRVFLLCILVISSNAFAGLSKDLTNFYSKFGASSNFTPGGAYYGQMGGSFTGGSAYVRSPVRNLQLFNFEMPSISAGCQGIDIFTGGMGFVNSKQIIQQMKAIGANAQGYLFSLMMNQISPQISAEIKEWLAMANEHNMNNINSCQVAMQAVDSGVNMIHSSLKTSCVNKYLKDNGGTRTEAMQHCQSGKNAAEKVKEAAKDPETQVEAIASNVNLTWYAINKNPILKDLDKDTKHLLMSLIGTVVIDTTNEKPKQTLYPGKLKESVLEDLSSESTVELYTCSDKDKSEYGCLKLTERKVKLDKSKGFISQVKAQLQEVEKGIELDTKPTEKEASKLKAFLDTTVIPVYHILNIHANTSFSSGNPQITASEYANLIAMDVLYKFLNQSISDVMQAISGTMLPEKTKNDLVRMVQNAADKVRQLQAEQIKKIKTTNAIVLRVQTLDKLIRSNSSLSIANNLNFQKDL